VTDRKQNRTKRPKANGSTSGFKRRETRSCRLKNRSSWVLSIQQIAKLEKLGTEIKRSRQIIMERDKDMRNTMYASCWDQNATCMQQNGSDVPDPNLEAKMILDTFTPRLWSSTISPRKLIAQVSHPKTVSYIHRRGTCFINRLMHLSLNVAHRVSGLGRTLAYPVR
jgi:hypothetical protein